MNEGIVKKIKPKTAHSRCVNTSTSCWNFFTVPGLDENSSKCSKCAVNIVCVDKNNKLTTTALNSHLRVKHGNQLDAAAVESIHIPADMDEAEVYPNVLS